MIGDSIGRLIVSLAIIVGFFGFCFAAFLFFAAMVLLLSIGGCFWSCDLGVRRRQRRCDWGRKGP